MTDQKVMILDGGLGRELERRGAPFRQPEWSALAMMETPEIVKQVHKDFIRSGARVMTTNSYALVPFHIGEDRFRRQARSLAVAAGEAAHQAVAETDPSVLVAGSIPPLFGSYRADFFQPGSVLEIATPLIEGLAPFVDRWLCETQSLIAEATSVVSLIKRLDGERTPVWVAFTLDDTGSTNTPSLRSGESVAAAVSAMVEQQVDAILFNCCQPEVIGDAVVVTREILSTLQAQQVRIGAYANAFMPQAKDAMANDDLSVVRDDLTPQDYLAWARRWQAKGVTLIGGCCGVGPDHIALLAAELNNQSEGEICDPD